MYDGNSFHFTAGQPISNIIPCTHGHRLFGCHTDDKEADHLNQEWTYNSNGTITSVMSGKCMEAKAATGNNIKFNIAFTKAKV